MRRGGGIRGGGSRSSSRGGSSRGYRTSRRHHGRPRYGYYGGGYYGRRGYGYGDGRGVLIAVIAVVFIFVLISILIISAALSSAEEISVNLGSGENRSFSTSFWRNGIEIRDASGIIQTHFFQSAPTISGTVDRVITETSSIAKFEFEFWAFYLLKGSTMEITWSSDSAVTMWIVAGTSDFDTWKSGSDAGTEFTLTTSFTYLFTATSNNDYYIVFDNAGVSTTITVTFDITSRVFDVSNSNRMRTGSFSESNFDEEFVVLHNPSNNDLTFIFVKTARFGFGLILLVEVAVIASLIYIFQRRRKSKKKTQKRSSLTNTQQLYQTGETSSQNPQILYNQRPVAKFCRACGAAVLPNSIFCTECGTKI